jgi:hypothetical protein
MAESALRRLIPSARDRILSQQGQMPTAPMPQETFRGRAFNTMYDMFGGSSEDPARRAQATRRAESVMGAGRLAADFTPVVGDALAIDEARDAYRQGNMGQAAILTGLATLGMVPLVGDAAARAARGATSPLEGVLDMSQAARMQRADEGRYLPETYYHATSSDFEEFVPKYADQLTFLTPNVNFANNWLGKGGSKSKLMSARYNDPINLEYKAEGEKIWDKYSSKYGADIDLWPEEEMQNYRNERGQVMDLFNSIDQSIYPLRTNVQNTFDPRQHEDVIIEYLRSQGRDPSATTIERGLTDLDYYKLGNYLLYENPEMVELLKNKGFDSMRLAESTYDRSVDPVFDTLAVFNPSNIRSVNAAFDPAKRGSANILATAAGGTISLSALRQLMPQEEERPIE